MLDRLASNWFRGWLIALNAAIFKPDLVHVLEFQNGGYSYLRARALSATLKRTKLLLTPYGSDIYWFQKYPRHLVRIKQLLSAADAISAECRRDERLARKYGFTGIFGPTVPAFGVLALDSETVNLENRQTIAVKGYQNHWGQALNSLKAVEAVAEKLRGFEIVVYSCNSVTIRAAREMAQRTGLVVRTYGKGALKHAEVQQIFRKSLALVALSTSDGQSASMVESMAAGAVPIHSRTSCCDEWLEDGVGGFLVDYDDIDGVSEKLAFLVDHPEFRRSAAQANFEFLTSRLDPKRAMQDVEQTYLMLKGA